MGIYVVNNLNVLYHEEFQMKGRIFQNLSVLQSNDQIHFASWFEASLAENGPFPYQF